MPGRRVPRRVFSKGGVSFAVAILLLVSSCGGGSRAGAGAVPVVAAQPGFDNFSADQVAFLDSLERRTFDFFWERSDAKTGLTPDRWPTPSFSSIAAVGFALTAYPIGAEHGWITRKQARDRVMTTLQFFRNARQDTMIAGAAGYRGFFYHFLDMSSGARYRDVELSTVDTALLMAGVLFCQSYFDHPDEAPVRAVAESLYARVEWDWSQVRPPAISHGWKPESGFLEYDWVGFNETMLVQILALGAPLHPATGDVWTNWTKNYRWGEFQGHEYVGFAPLFGYQYTHVWIDFRGIRDAYGREKGLDYFENSRRATLAQRDYAIANPGGWKDYGERLWGLTACDGPIDKTIEIDGRPREFHTYWGRGATFGDVRDDGTVAPTAAGGSIVFAPDVVVPALMAMREDYGEHVYSRYGFVDALNPTLALQTRVPQGHVVPGVGWFDTDYLGIDQGPIVCMIENQRNEFVWNVMRRNPHVLKGLQAAGFTGGWLDQATRK